MSLSSTFKSFLLIAFAFNLGACSYFLPNTSPNLGGLLAEKGDTRPFETPLPVNTEPKRMALGSMFAIGVKADGTVWSWGDGGGGVLGTDGFKSREIPQAIPNMTDFVEVAAGNSHVLALRKDGAVWSWGNNEKGQLGYKEDGLSHYSEPLKKTLYKPYQLNAKQIPDLKDIVSIAAGSNFSLALDRQGRVWGWGSKAHILNNVQNEKDIKKIPFVVYENKQAAKVIADSFDSAILTKEGNGLVWKYLDSNTRPPMPILLNTLMSKSDVSIADIALSHSNIYILSRDGFAYAQGFNYNGELGDGTFEKRKEFVKVKNIGHLTQITRSMALDNKGRLWRWGGGLYLRPNIAGGNSSKEPYPINILTDRNINFILRGNYGGAVGFNNGDVSLISKKEVFTISSPEKSLWTWK
ncbi:MAG: hypothetical protein Q7S87_13760 [Agitococcus sp.]|nr:hypothetical protein [Agitococcus sp.]MDO9178328.1 hypothetical protein [Agitococcus sp.]